MRCHKEYAIQVFGNRVKPFPLEHFKKPGELPSKCTTMCPMCSGIWWLSLSNKSTAAVFLNTKLRLTADASNHIRICLTLPEWIEHQTTINSRTLLRSKMRPTQNKGEFNGFRQHNIYTYLYCSHQKLEFVKEFTFQRVYFPQKRKSGGIIIPCLNSCIL